MLHFVARLSPRGGVGKFTFEDGEVYHDGG